MIGKVMLAILALFLLIGAFRVPITDGIKGWRTSDITQIAPAITAAGVYSDNIELSYDLYQASLAQVVSISTNSTGAPAPSGYTEDTKVLLVTNLNPSETVSLSIRYYAETDDEVMRILGPFLAFLIFGGLAGMIIYSMFQKQGGRR